MSKSAVVKSVNLSAQSLEEQAFELTSPVGTPAWKQEVNDRLAAHRTRRGGPNSSGQESEEAGRNDGLRSASSRAVEAAARVAARYAKAPSYKQLLAGEARAVVRAAGAAAEAARNAQAAAQAVLTGLQFGPDPQTTWEPEAPAHQSPKLVAVQAARAMPEAQTAPARWQDEPPVVAVPLTAAELAWQEYETIHGPQHMPEPRWEEPLPPAPAIARDEWSEMRLHSGLNAMGSHPGESLQYSPQYSHGQDAEQFPHHSHDPIGDATVHPVQPISANLIAFPKELIAARKARPRQADGPFYDPAKDSPQLSIFEVDPDLLAPPIYLSDVSMDVAPPEWATIQLDQLDQRPSVHAKEETYTEHVYAHPVHDKATLPDTQYENPDPDLESGSMSPLPHSLVELDSIAEHAQERFAERVVVSSPDPKRAAAWESAVKKATAQTPVTVAVPGPELFVAPLSDRVLAAVVDGALITLAFLAAAMVVMASTAHPPTGGMALLASACGLLIFGTLYQFLFFSFAEEGTPGMRYARIALCSFEDENPSREQIRKRIPAFLLSALPVGLGLAWAFIDGDSLAMHDRLTKTYQRKY